MPPRAKKPKTSVSSNEEIPAFPAPPAAIPPKDDTHTTPPEHNPARQIIGITQAQKQALIDNLQLEITERARKLRAQYALQAQGLRARLEMRINRIPQVLRKRKMQDLLDEHAEKSKPAPSPPLPAKDDVPLSRTVPSAVSALCKSLKRQSDQISMGDDKENVPAPQSSQDLANPKKRTKTATANTKATRTASKKIVPSTVLSPRFLNSRTLPRSPFKSVVSLEKPKQALPRPMSPAKSSQHAASKFAARAPSRQVKRGPATTASDSEGPRSSEASNTSGHTTIVTTSAGKKASVVAKKPAAGRKPTVSKKENVPPATAAASRVLRKRG